MIVTGCTNEFTTSSELLSIEPDTMGKVIRVNDALHYECASQPAKLEMNHELQISEMFWLFYSKKKSISMNSALKGINSMG